MIKPDVVLNPFIEWPGEYRTWSPLMPGGRPHEQWKFTFDNGYSASVVRGEFTYGGEKDLWELAVIHDGEIVYDTPVSDDVLGCLTDADVTKALRAVGSLEPR